MEAGTVIAHRGLNTIAPENTMAAFRLAHERGVKWLETDVDILADGTPIICHDTYLDRTTNRTGKFYGLTAADLDNIDAGSWFSADYKGEPLPRLATLVDFLNETGMNANIEIKPNEAGRDMSLRLLEAVAHEIKRVEPGIEILVSCFNHVMLAKFKEMMPHIPVACLYTKDSLWPDCFTTLQLVGADFIHPEDASMTRERIQLAREFGIGVNVWTVNSRARANELFNWGATGVISDVADQIPEPNQA